jgi:hypothetical protein
MKGCMMAANRITGRRKRRLPKRDKALSLVHRISEIRSLLNQSKKLDNSIIEQDIRSRWLEAQAGYRWANLRTRLRADYKRRGISEEQGTQEDFHRSLQSMRRRVRLYRNWKRYETERRENPNGDYWGLLYGLTLIPQNERYAPISRPAKAHSGTDEMLDPSMCRLITGDSREVLTSLGDGSIQCIVTSPAFWPTRRTFGGKGLGLEKTFDGYLANFLSITAECQRVLADDGVFWLHLEDFYSHSGGTWRPDSMVTWRPTSQKPLIETGARMPARPGWCRVKAY